jgi:hypothetical protein
MDPTKLLDLERRTGVKNVDIDDFVRKASDVEAAVKAMLEGIYIYVFINEKLIIIILYITKR